MEKKQLFDKLSDYYSGEEDQQTLKKELESDSESRETFQWVDLLWTKLFPRSSHAGQIEQLTVRKIDSSNKSIIFPLRFIKYAAIVLLVLSVGGILYYHISPEEVSVIKATSGVGQMKVVDLPDGSKAWLNAESSLVYPERFEKANRDVEVTGEVYFEVQHDEKHPFIVHSKYIQIRVLGTSFMVSSYADEPEVNAYLVKGSIALEIPSLDKMMKLIPGDAVVFEKATGKVTQTYNPALLDSWRNGGISFYRETLFEIARKLKRKFGVEVQIPDEKVGEMNFTADFEKENLDQILNYICKSSDLRYERTSDGYVITTLK